jgi:hypothetical protein
VPAVAVFIGMLPLPIDAYHLIRWIVACTCSFGAYKTLQKNNTNPAKGVILIIMAFVFNPIIPLYLGRTIWLFVDIVVGGTLVRFSFEKSATTTEVTASCNPKSQISAKIEKIEKNGDEFVKRALINAIGLLIVFALITFFMKS